MSSFIPYAGRPDDDRRRTDTEFRKTNLSMHFAADYPAGQQSWFEWGAIAREAGLSRVLVTDWASAVTDSLPQLITAAASSLPSHLQTDIVARFVERTSIRAGHVVAAIAH
ncbi:hypothetical protein E3T31_11835 [Cryobacterium sp. TMS1-13-1]|nr:hypothetical protein E3T31_11835 [Cryobacterium sp. TMS1-13-1]